jgi:NAD(P)-dependent dehydrogenase (short-subunit alcohol dehydrogenase family)/acyl carrier protein
MDRSGLGIRLCDEMMRLGRPSVRVEPGSGFSKSANDRYSLDPRNPEHYRRLLTSVSADGIDIGQILHLWTYDVWPCDIASAEDLERAQDLGVLSVLFLVQALAQRQGDLRGAQLWVVSCGSQEVLPADDATYVNGSVLGLMRTIAQEMSWLDCRHLDLPTGDVTLGAALALKELTNRARDMEVAYRWSERWVPRLRRVDFKEEECRALPFRRGGMYLVSGALGGLGKEVARYLLEQYEVKLIAIGRTSLAPGVGGSVGVQGTSRTWERIKALRELEQLPGAIHYETVDVCDLPAMRRVVEQARHRWQCDLDGVIHLAGIYQERSLEEETRETFASVLRPKLLGSWVLTRLLADRLDSIFVSFSSVNGSLGGAMAGAYSAANSFLEGFARHQRRRGCAKSYCIEWSMWDELGMSRGYPLKELTRIRGYHIISAKQGLSSVLAALEHDWVHVLVGLDGSNEHVRNKVDDGPSHTLKLCGYFTSKVDGAPGKQLQDVAIRDPFGARIRCECHEVSRLPRTDAGVIDRDKLIRLRVHSAQAATEWVAPRTELEHKIANIWRGVLATSQLSIHDNFFGLGGNSLLATQVASRIQDNFGVQLPLRTMLEESTVARLAAAVQRQIDQALMEGSNELEKIETSDAKSILARLDGMSDEEVTALLNKALAQGDR